MSILNVNQIQPVGGGNTITVSASDVSASGATITASSFVGDLTGNVTGNITGNVTGNITGNVTGNITGTTSNASGATGDFSIADKIVHTGDTNTAIRFPAADTITAETGGSERLRIDSSGNYKLITGSGGTLTFGIANGVGTQIQRLLYDDSDGSLTIGGGTATGYPLKFFTGNDERLRITSGGLVGIATAVPSYRLDIGDGTTDPAGGNQLRVNAAGDYIFALQKQSNASFSIRNNSTGIVHLNTQNSKILSFGVSSGNTSGSIEDDVRIDSNGHLEIRDGNLVVADGHGIDFSATGNSSGSMSSELLDDYEEGTFTPTVYGSSTAGTFNIVSGGSNEGWYVKIGQYVHMIIRWKNVYLTGAAGNLLLGNLPFSFDNTNSRLGGFSTYLEGFTPSFNKGFTGSQSVCFRRNSATAVSFRPSSANEWDVYFNAGAVSWQRNGGNSSQRTYGEIQLYGHTPS